MENIVKTVIRRTAVKLQVYTTTHATGLAVAQPVILEILLW